VCRGGTFLPRRFRLLLVWLGVVCPHLPSRCRLCDADPRTNSQLTVNIRFLRRVFPFRIVASVLVAVFCAGPLHAAIEKLEVTYDYVRQQAAARASAPYQEPDRELPKRLAELNYDQIRDIRFKPEQALWRSEGLPFQLHLFHRSSAVREAVQIRNSAPPTSRPFPLFEIFSIMENSARSVPCAPPLATPASGYITR